MTGKWNEVPFETVAAMRLGAGDLVAIGRQKDGKNRIGRVKDRRSEWSEQMGQTQVVVRVELATGDVVEESHGLMQAVDRLAVRPVQAPDHTSISLSGVPTSYTEMARIVAMRCQWSIAEDGRVVQGDGEVVAPSLEILARALYSRGWIGSREGAGNAIHYKSLPPAHMSHGAEEVASAVRDFCDRETDWIAPRSVEDVLHFLGLSVKETKALLERLR